MLPVTKKKLIEVAIPLGAINAASVREKSIHHGHPSTLHLWWARRPLAACRAVLFAQLVDDPSSHPDKFPTEEAVEEERKRLFQIIEDLVIWENSNDEGVLERARTEIRKSCTGELPAVYDPFSGGGSIPLEALRLGLPAHGSDLNPVAVMIGKAMIEIPSKFEGQPPVHPEGKAELFYRGAEGLAEDVLWYARKLRDKAWKRIGHLYPKVTLSDRDGGSEETVLAWLWARTVASPNPAVGGAKIPLVSNYWLRRRSGKKVWIEPTVDGKEISFRVRSGTPTHEAEIAAGTKVGRGANFRCLLTGDAVTANYVKAEGMAGRMGWKLLAIVAEGKHGRRYVSPTKEHEYLAFSELPDWRPEYPLSQHPQYMSVTNYGPKSVSDLFMDRQTIALNTFIELIPEVVADIDASAEYKAAVQTYLALGVSRLANRQSTSTFWQVDGEKIGQVFAMQALPMRWDTAEGNPFSSSSGNFVGQVEYLAKSLARLPVSHNPGSITQKSAQGVDFEDYVLSTDPPYYDNVPYADLSDFFYVWLCRSLKRTYPDLFQTMLVPKLEELVADHKRHNGKDVADEFFLDGMTQVMSNMARQGRQDIPATIFYAFRQGEVDKDGLASTGWATFLQAVLAAGYQVGATWPVRTELVGNLKKDKNVLATSVVLSCRPRTATAETVSRSEFVRSLRRKLPKALSEMQHANIAPADMPQAAIGPGMAVFSRFKAVLEADDRPMKVKTALQLINRELDEYLGGIQGDFDSETRFAVTWFEQNGMAEGDYGIADNIARARGISVESVKDAGIVVAAAGQVRTLKRDEIDPGWDPMADTRLTVWECCQHLIRALEHDGEHGAAILLKKIGPGYADAAKDLAYCLYEICTNKRRDAGEAAAYNGLIAVWAELTRQAATIHDIRSTRPGILEF